MLNTIPSASGIYRFTCTANGKFYVGSALCLNKRRREHLHGLRNNKHGNRVMQHAFNKYGEDTFIFDVLEIVLVPEMLTAREQYWIDTLKPTFNLAPIAGSQLGLKHSAETREKLRLLNLGKKQSAETIRKRAEGQIGRTHTDATKEKVRLIRLGTRRSPETCERLSIAHMGTQQSAETKEKHRIAMTDRPVSEATRARISESNVAGNAWRMKTIIVTAPDGTEYIATGIGKFCREHSLNRSALIQVAKCVHPHHKGWKARYA